ncbi:hypothetical protein RIF29_17420 [Crotalaria pallida]|uniref:Uncharacterized protein n=1 Tax=Crotalaria pallida TaxID=3830 RepID=A0AAN9FH27_CROPI
MLLICKMVYLGNLKSLAIVLILGFFWRVTGVLFFHFLICQEGRNRGEVRASFGTHFLSFSTLHSPDKVFNNPIFP